MLASLMMRPGPGPHIGNIGPVPLYVDPSAIFLVIFVFAFFDMPMTAKLCFFAALVLAIVLHEMGHALVALARGAQGVSIYVTGLGGLCSYSAYLNNKEKMMISLAGPSVNLVLAVIAWLLLTYVPPFNGHIQETDGIVTVLYLFIKFTLFINMFLGIFNLLPIFPMDGGQALLAGMQYAGNSEFRSRKITLITSFVAAGVGVTVYTFATGEPIDFFMTVILMILLYEAYKQLS